MKVSCGSCGAKYSLREEKLAGRRIKIRCRRCAEPIAIEMQASRAIDAQWYALIDGKQEGPLSLEALGALVRAGRVDDHTFVWRDGFAEWCPKGSLAELKSADDTDALPARSEMTASRQESSLLFSLANLRGLASSERRPVARADGASGLIDIHALAARTEPRAQEDERVALESGAASPALVRLELAPSVETAQGSRRGLLVWSAAAASLTALALAAIAIALLVRPSGAPPPRAGGPGAGRIEQAPPARPASFEAAPRVAVEREGLALTATAIALGREAIAEPRPPSALKVRRPRRAPPEPSELPERRVEDAADGSRRTLEVLLEVATGPAQPVAPRVAPPRNAPSRDEIGRVMRTAESAARACAQGATGLVRATVVFSGSTGRVSEVQVQQGRPELEQCVRRASRALRVAPFDAPSFSVAYPFRL